MSVKMGRNCGKLEAEAELKLRQTLMENWHERRAAMEI